MKRNPLAWLKANGHNLAPLTGQDTAALLAAVACWELYALADERGRTAAVEAVRALLPSMQPASRHLVVKVIPFALDWSDEQRLGALVNP